jgi:hypothetical protein
MDVLIAGMRLKAFGGELRADCFQTLDDAGMFIRGQQASAL